MKYGLTEQQINEIREILASYQEVEQAILFGSRAIDTFKEASDVDIAIIGDKCDLLLSAKIKDHLEDETYLPFFFDIIAYNTIKSPELKEHIQTKGKILFQREYGWKEVKLGKLLKFGNGKKKPNSNGNIPIYGGNGILGCCSENNYINETIIIGRVGAYCGSVYFENRPIWISDNALSAKPKADNNLKFLYYFLKNINLNSYAGGSSHPLITQTLLNSLEFNACTDPVKQKAIAEVLSSLDDKIDLLGRQNKTLEEMAETLFRQWFIEERDEGWEEGELGDILSVIESGKRPKGGIDPSLAEGFPSVGAENINGIGNYKFGSSKYITEEFYYSLNKGIVKDYDVLIYKDGAYIGKKAMFGLGFPFKEFAVNEHVFILRSNEKANQFYLYFLLQQDDLASLNTNSAQPGLNQTSMKNLQILIPPKSIVEKFGSTVEPYVIKILKNSCQTRKLENLRDALLPKLMSGEISVKYGK